MRDRALEREGFGEREVRVTRRGRDLDWRGQPRRGAQGRQRRHHAPNVRGKRGVEIREAKRPVQQQRLGGGRIGPE
jgi:hypothetical protein